MARYNDAKERLIISVQKEEAETRKSAEEEEECRKRRLQELRQKLEEVERAGSEKEQSEEATAADDDEPLETSQSASLAEQDRVQSELDGWDSKKNEFFEARSFVNRAAISNASGTRHDGLRQSLATRQSSVRKTTHNSSLCRSLWKQQHVTLFVTFAGRWTSSTIHSSGLLWQLKQSLTNN